MQVRRLLRAQHKVDVNAANEHGNTALHYAAFWGYESICADLLQAGAELGLCNKYDETPADICRPSAHKALVGASCTLLSFYHPPINQPPSVCRARRIAGPKSRQQTALQRQCLEEYQGARAIVL